MTPLVTSFARLGCIALAGTLLAACAAQPKPPIKTQAPVSIETQKAAQVAVQQSAPEQLTLKRKVALGRISNETLQGRSLLRDAHNDVLGKQVADMLSQRLVESGLFLVMERPDLERIQAEAKLGGTELSLVGADSLIIGSLVEFGRNTTGTTGFWSKTKKQTASAKVALRLVDTSNGLAYFSATGAGEASTESGEIAFAGSTAAYDGVLNDKAIAAAVSDVVDDLISNLSSRPWSTSILNREGNTLYVSGGKLQGLRPGLLLDIETKGKKIKSPQTGFFITLPGEKIATVKVASTFGSNETDEGSIARLVSGNLGNYNINELTVKEHSND